MDKHNTFKCTTCTSDQSVKELIERLNKELAGIPKPNSQTSETPYHPAKFKTKIGNSLKTTRSGPQPFKISQQQQDNNKAASGRRSSFKFPEPPFEIQYSNSFSTKSSEDLSVNSSRNSIKMISTETNSSKSGSTDIGPVKVGSILKNSNTSSMKTGAKIVGLPRNTQNCINNSHPSASKTLQNQQFSTIPQVTASKFNFKSVSIVFCDLEEFL